MRLDLFKKFNYWRVIEPIILGSLVNILVNYIFNPSNPDFIWDEFFNAWIFALIVTETNRKIDKALEKKYKWTNDFNKRFYLHLIYLSLSLLFFINVIGNIYLWIKGEGLHTLKEITIINLSVFVIALLLTLLKWTSHFYRNWRKTEVALQYSTEKINTLKSAIIQKPQFIELRKANELFKINTDEIQFAKSEFGVIWVYYQMYQKAIFHGTLGKLEAQLPKSKFFRVNRNIIINKTMIISLSSSTYGKVLLKVKDYISKNDEITVSRPKASSFRKWYNSNSTTN